MLTNAQMVMMTVIQMLIVQTYLVRLPALVPQAILVMDRHVQVRLFKSFIPANSRKGSSDLESDLCP